MQNLGRPDESGATESLRVHHFVDGGRVCDPPSRVALLAPLVTDEGLRAIPMASSEEAEHFIAACTDGLARWLAIGRVARVGHLARVVDALSRHAFELAEAVADDGDISCETAVRLAGQWEDTLRAATSVEPVDPILPVGIHLIVASERMTGRGFLSALWPLLIAGSIVVIRPSLQAPRAISFFVELAAASGLPDGVLNVIHGDGVAIEALSGSPLVAGVVGPPSAEVAALAERMGKRTATIH